MSQGNYMVFDRSSQYQAYNLATHTVPKTKQIVILYDGVVRFMQQAHEAIQENRIEDRFNLLVKASEIIVSLQACLDHENGGEIARILHDYYSSIDMRILSVHHSGSPEMCERIIKELRDMRSAWHHIDTNVEHQPAAAAPAAKKAEAASADTAPSPASAPRDPNASMQISA